MSLSTTTKTTTFELVKYSRAYTQSTNYAAAASQSDLEWQHFSNPVIRLTLDIRKSPTGHLESYRLRIVWSFGAGADSMDVDERDVVFEDLDLVSYSALPSLQTPLGMPLKAVYQAATVGLRYQHPRVVPPGQSPQYRRFQVAFLTESAAGAFIDSIRFICPCKANTGPPARMPRPNSTQRNTMFKSQASMMAHTTTSVARPSVTLRQSGSAMTVDEYALPSHRPTTVRRDNTILPVSEASIDHFEWGDVRPAGLAISQEHHRVITTQSAPSPMNDSDGSRPSSAVTASSAIAHHASSGPISDSQAILVDDHDGNRRNPVTTPSDPERPSSSQRRRKEMFAQGGSSSDVDTSLSRSSLPASSPPRPLPRSPVLMPPPPVPRQASLPMSSQTMQTPPSSAPGPKSGPHAASGARPSVNVDVPLASGAPASTTLQSDIAATLRDDAGLYQLSSSQLESLVAEVVREKGFKELMAALDGMWKIKGLAGIDM